MADLTFAARQIRRYPGVGITAIISLALGIGSATAVFSVVHGVVLDPFPYKDVGSLMSIQVSEPGQRGGRVYYTVDQFLEFRDSTALFEGVTASTISDLFWTGRPAPERLRGNHTTYDGLEIMGVPALIGRIFTRADRGSNVCVLGFRFWQRQFTGDPGVLGKTLLLNGKSRTIVGVMPPRSCGEEPTSTSRSICVGAWSTKTCDSYTLSDASSQASRPPAPKRNCVP